MKLLEFISLQLLLILSLLLPPMHSFITYSSRSLLTSSKRTGNLGSLRRCLSVKSTNEEIVDDAGQTIPTSFDSKFLNVMLERGFIYQCTDFKGLDEKMNSGVTTAYLGFDATASSLHVGSLLQIMILRHLQKCGHKPVVLIGGGTTKVGDPSGKDESRQLMTEETIQQNINSLTKVFSKFIKFGDGPTDAILVNNAEWLDHLNYLQFLRDYGRLFTVNRMLSYESVKQRLAREQPLSFLEFNYLLLQSYDFVELYRRYKTTLQLGGSDQWGNIVSGVELGRKVNTAPLFGLTAPLITTSDGRKMGKTASGAVWLNGDLLSEYDYWQFWRNTADADVIRFLKLFTEVPIKDIEAYSQLEGSQLNPIKRILADEATSLLHGRECLAAIHQTVDNLFAASSGGSMREEDLASLPHIQLEADQLIADENNPSQKYIPLANVLHLTKVVKSRNEGRRMITSGGVKLNDKKCDDEKYQLTEKDFEAYQGRLKITAGKKKHFLILWVK